MTATQLSFWLVMAVLFGMVIVIALMARKSDRIDRNAEHVASTALPTIGKIAEREHAKRFGQPTEIRESGTWFRAKRLPGKKGNQ